jgi:hypothetical protein
VFRFHGRTVDHCREGGAPTATGITILSVTQVSHDNPQPQHHRVRVYLRFRLLNRSNPTRSHTRPLQYFLSTSLFLHCTFIVSQLNCRPSPLLLPMTRDFSTLAGGTNFNSHRHREAKAASSTTAEWVPSKFRVLIFNWKLLCLLHCVVPVP